VLVVHKTTSKLEMRDLGHPIICQCRKHRQLVHQEGGFGSCFPLNVLMDYSPKLTFIANSNNLTSVRLTSGETICFGSLELTTDRLGNLSLSPEGNDPGIVFVVMVHNGSLSLHLSSRNPPMRATLTRAEGRALVSPALEGATW
jgi:hypothetical protein